MIRTDTDVDYRPHLIQCIIGNNYKLNGGTIDQSRVLSGHSIQPHQNTVVTISDTVFENATLDMSVATTGTYHLKNCKGILAISNLTTAGTIKIYSGGGLSLTIAASCTAGTIEIYGNLDDLINSGTSTVTLKKAIYQKTKTAIEDVLELMYARLAGYNQLANTGVTDSHLEVKLYNYLEDTLRKTINILKPAGTNNTQTIDTNAMAGQKES